MKRRLRDRITWRGVLLVVAAFVLALGLLQLVPYRYDNPPVRMEPPWDSPRTRQLAVDACFDCHSNETDPYWFENIAPAVWLITADVNAGRDELNFSECEPDPGRDDGEDAAEAVLDGSMPPSTYTFLGILHPEAQLSDAERRELAQGLVASLADVRCD